MRPKGAFLAAALFLACLAAVPSPVGTRIKISAASVLEIPLASSSRFTGWMSDLWNFRSNADEMRRLREERARSAADRFELEEIRLENRRLTKLLELRTTVPPTVKRTVAARVIARAPSTWMRALLIDKGTRDGVRPNMLVLAGSSLAGKVAEAGPSVAKVMLVSDPNFRVGALVQRTRQQGVIFGTLSSACRMKYLSPQAELKPGDEIETAGFGAFFPKSIRIGAVSRSWREPGQIYRTAEVTIAADLDRLEEVICIE